VSASASVTALHSRPPVSHTFTHLAVGLSLAAFALSVSRLFLSHVTLTYLRLPLQLWVTCNSQHGNACQAVVELCSVEFNITISRTLTVSSEMITANLLTGAKTTKTIYNITTKNNTENLNSHASFTNVRTKGRNPLGELVGN